MFRYLLYLLGALTATGGGVLIWQHRLHPPMLGEAPVAVAADTRVTTAPRLVTTLPTEQHVKTVWQRELRRPLYDPPPPEPKPPPPPPPTIPIAVVGWMEESGRSYVLLQIGGSGQQLMGVGEKVNASGTEVEVVEISAKNVQLRVGSREVTLDRK